MIPRAPFAYRVLLWLAWPARVRHERGRELEQMFTYHLTRARHRGFPAVVIAWTRGTVDVMGAGAIAHAQELHNRLHPLPAQQQHMATKSMPGFGGEFRRDVTYAVRTLLRERVFTVTALLTLIVCLAGNAAIFSIVRSVLLKPLPIPDAERVMLISNIYPKAASGVTGPNGSNAGAPDYFDRLEQTTAFSHLAMYRRGNIAVDLPGGAQRATYVRATPSFFSMLHAQTVRGRAFGAGDGEVGADGKVILSYGYWQRGFGGDSAILGKDIRVNGVPVNVVGVMQPTFEFVWNDVDLWLPLSFPPAVRSDNARHSNNYNMIGLLKPGATVSQAQREIDAVNARNADRFPQLKSILENAGFRTIVAPLQDEVVREIKPALYLLWGGAILVLLVGCVNLANLFMVRSAGRSREMAIRHAIGARLPRLVRQLLTETTFLTVTGGAIGIVVAAWVLRSASGLHLDLLPRGHEIRIDWTSTLAMLGLAALVGVITGLTPIAQLARVSVSDTMRDGGRGGSSGAAPNRLRSALAMAQVALAFVLLVGAGLLLVSFRAVLKINPGFESANVLTATINLPASRYRNDTALAAGADRLLAGIRAIPGVVSAGTTSGIPFADGFGSSVIIPEGYQKKGTESLLSPLQIVVSPGYFETMHIPLVKGRNFDARDIASAGQVVLVDERLAERFWPGQDAVGRRLYTPQNSQDLTAVTSQTQFITVIGVVRNVPLTGLAPHDPLVGAYYYPQAQQPARALVIAARTQVNPVALTEAVHKAVATFDPELPLYAVQTMDQRLDQSLVPRRLPMLLATAFGLVALFLAAIGIYGVLAYRVTQRRREIGIRLALGSSAGDVFALVFRDGLRITLVGLAIGGAGLFAMTRVMAGLLYGVRPLDVGVIGVVALILSAVSLTATLVPARRAAKVDPVGVLSE